MTSSSGGISGSISAVGLGSSCPGVVDGVDDVADVVDGVAVVVDGVTFAASHAAFSTLVSFCPGSYCFPVSPSYNFLGATWNSSEMVELLSLLLNKCLCRTVWITATRQRVGCLGGRNANARWNGLVSTGLCQFLLLFLGVLNAILKTSSPLGCTGMVVVIVVPRGVKNVS